MRSESGGVTQTMNDVDVSQADKIGSAGIRVLVVDSHAVMRDGLRALLNLTDDIRVVGDAFDGEEAVSKAEKLSPDVVVMDLALPGMGGVDAIRRVMKTSARTKVLVLTRYCDREHVILSIKAGAAGYVPKEASGSEVVSAIRAVYHGQPFLDPLAASFLIDDYLLHQTDGEPYDGLSSRECEILRLVAQGETSRKIADRLSISLKTVLGHRTNIMKKLALHNRAELIKYAIRKGLAEVDA